MLNYTWGWSQLRGNIGFGSGKSWYVEVIKMEFDYVNVASGLFTGVIGPTRKNAWTTRDTDMGAQSG